MEQERLIGFAANILSWKRRILAKVYNHYHKDAPENAVDVSRPSSFGNPFVWSDKGSLATIKVKDREAAIQCYEKLLNCFNASDVIALIEDSDPMKVNRLLAQAEWIRNKIPRLVNKDLVCWCAPLSCHADVLLRMAQTFLEESK